MQQTIRASTSYYNQMIKLVTMFFLITAILLFLLGCQLSPRLAKTTEFNEEMGRLYVHQINSEPAGKTKVLVDGIEINDFAMLDQFGITQNVGEHELEFFNLPVDSGISEIDYKIQKGKDMHLFYCREDGSFHWFSEKAGESFDTKKIFCNKATSSQP